MKTKLPPPSTALSSIAMASALSEVEHHISDRQVRHHFAAGAPRTTPEAFVAWVHANEARAPRNRQGNPALASLRAQKLIAEIEILKLRKIASDGELEKLRARLVSVEEVKAQMRRVSDKIRAVFAEKFVAELPPKLAGCSAAAIADTYRHALDECFAILHTADYK